MKTSGIQIQTAQEVGLGAGTPTGFLNSVVAIHESPWMAERRRKAMQHFRSLGQSETMALLNTKHVCNPWTFAGQPRVDAPTTLGLKQNIFPATNAVLTDDAWRMLTDEVVQVSTRDRVVLDAYLSRGLVMPLDDIGTFTVDWHKMGRITAPTVSMYPNTDRNYDREGFTLVSVPVPIIYKDFFFNSRELLAARKDGRAPIDAAHIAQARTLINEKQEDLILNGDLSISWNGAILYGATTHPDRLTLSGSDFGTTTQAESTFRTAIATLRANNHRGPYTAFVAETQWSQLKQQYASGQDTTAREFILNQHPELEDIVEAPALADGSMIIQEMRREVSDIAIAEDVNVIQWDDMAGAGTFWRVWSSMTPRFKVDADGQAGWIHVTGI